MKKFILELLIIFGFLAFVTSGAYAQNADMSWCENAPDKYLPTTTKEIINRTSPCNQGGEAFMDFIPKFRSNAQFRKSRSMFSDDMSKMTFEYFDNYSLLKPTKRTRNVTNLSALGLMFRIMRYALSIRTSCRVARPVVAL